LEQVWLSQPLEGAWKPLKDVQFGRFDPNDGTHSRRTTHAFYRAPNGEWYVKKLSDPASDWEHVGGSSFPLSELRFGDFTGDGVTDVLAVEEGRWAISESARKPWRNLNPQLNDEVKGLFIANMDADDNKDDILCLEVRPPSISPYRELIWWRSKNGDEAWKEFKRYYPFTGVGFVYPHLGFVGRFSTVSGGTLVIDEKRIGHFYSPGSDWTSRFPY
jgi:hypothetical protein